MPCEVQVRVAQRLGYGWARDLAGGIRARHAVQQDEPGLLGPERGAGQNPDPGVVIAGQPTPGLLGLTTALPGQREIPAVRPYLTRAKQYDARNRRPLHRPACVRRGL